MMAAGRHGAYRDNQFCGDSNVSKRDFSYSRKHYDRIGRSDAEFERAWQVQGGDKDGHARERARIRHKDIKGRAIMNGAHTSVSSRSGSGNGEGVGGWSGCGLLVSSVDREPGELSSESQSPCDGVGVMELDCQAQESKCTVFNGVHSPVQSKKRKFSPIVWDRDDQEESNLSRVKFVSANANFPPPPPPSLPQSYSPNPNYDGGIQIYPIEERKSNILDKSPVDPPVAVDLSVSVASKLSTRLSVSPVEEHPGSHNNEAERVDDDYGYLMTRTIKYSRWVNDADSPIDEGEILVDEDVPTSKGTKLLYDSYKLNTHKRTASPQPEAKREGYEGTRGSSSSSSDRIRSSSRDYYTDNDLGKDDSMDVDEDCDNDGNSIFQSDMHYDDEQNVVTTLESTVPPQRNVNMLQGCRSVDEFERLNKIDEGTYGVVYRAKDKKTGEIVALKKVKMEKEREGFPLTSLREINILLSFHHPSIVDVKEVVVGSSLDSIFMVMEYMEHDLKGLMETMKQPFSQSEVKCLMLQLLEGVKYLHDNWVLHRDLKTSNLLLNNQGELKICDFGLARQYGSPWKPYTHLVVTLWYRAPELLLGLKEYSTAIDMWSLGCIMAELLSKEPLFNGKTEFVQLDKIFRTLGTPNETIWPGFSKLPGVRVNFVKHQYNLLRKKFPATSFTGSPVLSDAGFDLLNKLLTYDPKKRITAEEALNHEWFREVPLPKSKAFMPTFPAQHAQDRRMRRIMKSPDPLEEQRRKELQQGELGTGGIFG